MKKVLAVIFSLAAFGAYGQAINEPLVKMNVTVPLGMFSSPVDNYIITSHFGDRQDVFGGGDIEYHKGIDLASTSPNASVRASAEGIVTDHYLPPGTVRNGMTYKGHPTFGGLIVVSHPGGITTLYAHLSKSYVHIGQTVKKGEIIGIMGKTGKATGVHLHFEVHGTIYGKYALDDNNGMISVQKLEVLLDPIPFILPPEQD